MIEEGKSKVIQEHTPITPTGLYCKEEVHSWVITGLEGNAQLRDWEWPCHLQTSASHPAQSKTGLSTEIPSTGLGNPWLMWLQPRVAATGQRLQVTQGGSKPSFPGENRPSIPSIAVAPKLVSTMQHLPGAIRKANEGKELGHSARGALQAHLSCLGAAPAFLLDGFEVHIVLLMFLVALARA